MSDRYSQLVRLPVAGGVAKRVGLPQPVELERGARVLRPRAARRRRAAGRGAPRGCWPRWASTRRPRWTIPCARTPRPRGSTPPCSTRTRRPTSASRRWSSTPPGSSRRTGRAAAVLLSDGPARAAVGAGDRARRRPARAGGLHALAGQGDRARRDGQPRARRGGRRGRDRADAALPALAALGVRLRAGRARRAGPTRCRSPGARALVTGASRGIGAAIAEVLEREGASVVRLDLKDADLELDITAADAPAARRALRGRARRARPQRRHHARTARWRRCPRSAGRS